MEYADFSIPLSFSMTKKGKKGKKGSEADRKAGKKGTKTRNSVNPPSLTLGASRGNGIDPATSARASTKQAKKGKLTKRKFEKGLRIVDKLAKKSREI
jgi:hypothetical protein